MLTGSFFRILSMIPGPANETRQAWNGEVALEGTHPIYQGHFPGNPVVPGVCQVHMILELAEKAVNRSLQLTASDNIKFMSMIRPGDHSGLMYSLEIKPAGVTGISVSAILSSGPAIFLKFKGIFEFTRP